MIDGAPKLWYYPYELNYSNMEFIELHFTNMSFIPPGIYPDDRSIAMRVVKIMYERVYFKNSKYEYLYVKCNEKKRFLEEFCE